MTRSELLDLDLWEDPVFEADVVELSPLTVAEVAEAIHEAGYKISSARFEDLADRAGYSEKDLRRELLNAEGLYECPNCNAWHEAPRRDPLASKSAAKAVEG